MKAVTVSTFRKHLKKYLAEVADSQDVLFISRKQDSDAVVCLSLQEYNSIVETGYLLSSKANAEQLFESIQQAEQGEYFCVAI